MREHISCKYTGITDTHMMPKTFYTQIIYRIFAKTAVIWHEIESKKPG